MKSTETFSDLEVLKLVGWWRDGGSKESSVCEFTKIPGVFKRLHRNYGENICSIDGRRVIVCNWDLLFHRVMSAKSLKNDPRFVRVHKTADMEVALVQQPLPASPKDLNYEEFSEYSTDEKKGKRPYDGLVDARVFGQSMPVGVKSYKIHVENLSLFDYDSIVIIENATTFFSESLSVVLSNSLPNDYKKPLVVYRGNDNASSVYNTTTLGTLRTQQIPIFLFCDFDPAGLKISHELAEKLQPCTTGLIVPAYRVAGVADFLSKNTKKQAFDDQIFEARKYFESVHNPQFRDAFDYVLKNRWAVTQESLCSDPQNLHSIYFVNTATCHW